MKCDKCGKEVDPKNDATIIEAVASGNPVSIVFSHARHFLPTESCEGSPSRSQYIEGQPRDTRGYRYSAEYEQVWRNAYQKVQKEYNA